MLRAARAGAVAVVAAALVLSACGEPASDDAGESAQPAGASVRFRLWDDAAATAYQESFDAFNAIHRDIHVEVEVVPALSYASRALTDLSSGRMADVFWVPSDALTQWVDLADVLEPPAGDWEPAVTDLFTSDGELWAVPQVWESSALFVNTGLLEQAGVDPAELVWDPVAPEAEAAAQQEAEIEAAREEADAEAATEQEDEPPAPQDEAPDQAPDDEPAAQEEADEETSADPEHTDTLRDAVRNLTRDGQGREATDPEFDADDVAEYGFNPDLAAPPVWLTFVAQGADSGQPLVLADDEEAADAFSYLLELTAVPAPADAPADRELFAEGRLALFQSTSADLRYLAEHSQGEWAVVHPAAGPGGAVSVVSGIGAAANAHSPHPEATAEVLRWVASPDGQSALASQSVGIPAAQGAQELFARAWADRGLETTALLDPGVVVTLDSGVRTAATLQALHPLFSQLFAGELSVAEALPAAQRVIEETK